jgi:hypothetical protein
VYWPIGYEERHAESGRHEFDHQTLAVDTVGHSSQPAVGGGDAMKQLVVVGAPGVCDPLSMPAGEDPHRIPV